MKINIDGHQMELSISGECQETESGELYVREDGNMIAINLESDCFQRILCPRNQERPRHIKVTIEAL